MLIDLADFGKSVVNVELLPASQPFAIVRIDAVHGVPVIVASSPWNI